jgi:WD40 repeat protein
MRQIRLDSPNPARADNTIRLWDMDTGKEIAEFKGHTAGVTNVAVSHDGRYAASVSADKTVRLLRLPD